jgi:hypothetical protein
MSGPSRIDTLDRMISARTLSALALLVAAAGIYVQMLGGANYPIVAPGVILLVVAAAITRFVPWRGAPVAAVAASVFLIFGLFAADQASRLVEVETALDTLGLWIQMIAVVVALLAAFPAMARPRDRTGV